jgi:uncharacterized protein YraI
LTPLQPGASAAGPTSSLRGTFPIGNGLYRVTTFLTLFAMLFGGLALLSPTSASAQSTTQVIDDLNLRAEPALNGTIINAMPTGSAVEIIGDPVNDFYPVSYQGQTGYAYGFYLGFGGGDAVTTGGQQSEVYVAAGPVNFRTGPSESDGVISVIPDGALVALTGDSANGFLGIIYTDQHGWAHADSIWGTGADVPAEPAAPAPPPAPSEPAAPAEPAAPESVPVGDAVTGSATVVDGALNLRTGPSTSYAVVTVMPGDAAVELRGEPMGGFQPLSFNGTLGWASVDFLQIGGSEPAQPETPAEPAPTAPPTEAPAPPTAVPAPPTEAPAPPSSEDDIIAIIYAAADQYGQPRADMLRVARCESVLDPSAVNAASNASGLFQFLPSTWATTPFADQSIFDPTANAHAAAWMWSVGRRNEWTCQ